MFTGRVLSRTDMLQAISLNTICGSSAYAEVNRDWLVWAYDDFKAELAKGAYGVISWTDRSKCTFFTTKFEGYAQGRFFAQAFHSQIAANSIAVGAFWYPVTVGEGHALCVVVTQNGREFFDPQSGRFVELTQAQYGNAFLRKFD